MPEESTERVSKDSTIVLQLCEEKLLKRLRQIGSGLFYIIMYEGKPIMLFVGGKLEVLEKIVS